MSNLIHETAIIYEGAELHESVEVGPYSIIGKNVKIAADCKIQAHTLIDGHTTIGENNIFFPFCSIGTPPQDMTYAGEPTETIIGKNNIFREYVSIHRGTKKQDLKTVVGSNCLLMAHVHLGHDVVVNDHCIFANSVNIAGHVTVGEKVSIGGGTNISQFVSIGRGSYLGGATAIDRDIPVFCTAYGNRAKLKGVNIIGLRRAGKSRQEITELVDFYRSMESSVLSPRAFVEKSENFDDFQNNELVKEMAEFVKYSEIGIAPFV